MNSKEAINQIKECLRQVPTPELQKEKIQISFPVFNHEEFTAVLDALLQYRISQGEIVKTFEKSFADFIGKKHAVAVNSGSSANLLIYEALLAEGKIKKGDEVIVPATTFITVVTPILQTGLVPVFVDVDRNSMNISPAAIEKAITPRTKAIMPVHTLGYPAPMDAIMAIARKHNLLVIEDSCEAHGSAIGVKKTGSWGHMTSFSFFVAHNMTTGEGGMIVTDDDTFVKRLRSLREFGRITQPADLNERLSYSYGNLKDYDTRYIFESVGYNVRMTDIAASLGIQQLRKLPEMNQRRVQIAQKYDAFFRRHSKVFEISEYPSNVYHSYYTYPVIIKEKAPFTRKQITMYLEQHGVETRPIFAGSLPDQPALAGQVFKKGPLPTAEYLRDHGFFIGCHPWISDEGVVHVQKMIEAFLNGKTGS